jgi:hypothetical protein
MRKAASRRTRLAAGVALVTAAVGGIGVATAPAATAAASRPAAASTALAAYPTGCSVWLVRSPNINAVGRCTGGGGYYQVYIYCQSRLHGTYLAESWVGRPAQTVSARCDGFTYSHGGYWISTWS